MPRPPSGFATLRDVVTFVLGVGVLAWVVAVRDGPIDPVGVGVSVVLLGLPAVFLGQPPPPPPPPPPRGSSGAN